MRVPVLGLLVAASALGWSGVVPIAARGQAVAPDAASRDALLKQYCVACHNSRTRAGSLALDEVDVTRPAENAEVWERVVRKLEAGLMPPAGRRRPGKAEREAFTSVLKADLDRVASIRPNPGRTEALHRLNRAEYRNAVRDLLAVDVDVTALLPSDDASYGFDNIAGTLKISQSRLEQYLTAARRISRAALGSPLPAPAADVFKVPETLQQYDHVDGLPFGTRGGMAVPYNVPRDGEYEIAIELRCRMFGDCDGSAGFAEEHTLQVLIDGGEIKSFQLEPRREFRPPEERTWRVRTAIKAGPHELAATFVKLPSFRETDSPFERFEKPFYVTGFVGLPHYTIYQPFIDQISITGPFGGNDVGATPSRRRILSCQPSTAADEDRCARTILTTLARRAYRRPVTAEDLEELLTSYRVGRSSGTFDTGIEAAIRRLLVSPHFLFRIERDPPRGVAPDAPYRISDLEFASRLSFFLWSSIPDDQLLDTAISGSLKEPAVLEREVRRMLSDPRSNALVENFTGQWLLLRNLGAVQPDVPLFPDFDDSLRQAFRKETELFFGSVVHGGRSAIELLTADYTFVNERLARHYGIPNVYGSQFRRVQLPDPNRRGLLGQGSILTVTSRPNRTSPVLRGKWILDNILGTPPPDPPADVPTLKESGVGIHGRTESVRERLARHRSNAVCAGCHSMIDPPGFALENYDAVGRWRAVDEATGPVDASGEMPDGTKFDGVTTFREILVSDPERFVTTLTERLLIYALGRGLEAYDVPAVRRILREATPGRWPVSSLIAGITRSVPFTMRRPAAPGETVRPVGTSQAQRQ